jgi:PHD/YefM family antitoxin component YafN of YafNO toxin-antitoxin module
MREFTSEDLQKKSGLVQEAALVEPIAITFRGRRRHVMMSTQEFERLQRLADPKVYRLAEIPDDLLQALSEAEMDPKHGRLDAGLDTDTSETHGGK